jgi:nitrite reductase (NADH) small subunit
VTAPVDARTARWVAVCRLEDLARERGAAALVDGEQVALVRLVDDRVFAVQQLDPFCGAAVMSRGIVGSRSIDGSDVPTLASPMFRQVFDLVTGRCLDGVGKDPIDLRTWAVAVTDGVVHIAAVPAGPVEAAPETAEATGGGPR